MDRALWRSARSQGRCGGLGGAHSVLRDAELRAADHGEFAGLPGPLWRRKSAPDRSRSAPRHHRIELVVSSDRDADRSAGLSDAQVNRQEKIPLRKRRGIFGFGKPLLKRQAYLWNIGALAAGSSN